MMAVMVVESAERDMGGETLDQTPRGRNPHFSSKEIKWRRYNVYKEEGKLSLIREREWKQRYVEENTMVSENARGGSLSSSTMYISCQNRRYRARKECTYPYH